MHCTKRFSFHSLPFLIFASAIEFRLSCTAKHQHDTAGKPPSTTDILVLPRSRAEIFRWRHLCTGTVFIQIIILNDIEFFRIFSQPPLPIYLVGAEFHRERSTFEERIVRLNGRNVNDFASSEALQGEARRTLKEVIERLRLIVDDTSSNEPALLAFFKTNPVATVLLEPETECQWREEAIQDYGQIDFVLELVDGTFRVVEIESATRGIFTAKNEFTHSTQHAIEQTRKWIRGRFKGTKHDQ